MCFALLLSLGCAAEDSFSDEVADDGPATVDLSLVGADASDLSSPEGDYIDGWLVLNRLDNSLMFYGPGGNLLGEVDERGDWRPAPGRDRSFRPSNAFVGSLVDTLGADQSEDRSAFLVRLGEQLDVRSSDGGIGSAESAISLLLGRPLAIVRLGVEIGGEPTDCSAQLGGGDRADDGLIGFWVVRDGGDYDGFQTSGETVAACSSDGGATVVALIDPSANVSASIDGEASSELSIASTAMASALERIVGSFLASPMLSPVGTDSAVPLPAEALYEWLWIGEDSGGFTLDDSWGPTDVGAFGTQDLAEGWLSLQPDGQNDDRPDNDGTDD